MRAGFVLGTKPSCHQSWGRYGQLALNFVGWVVELLLDPTKWQLELFLRFWQFSLRERLFGYRPLRYAMALAIFGCRI